MHRSRLPVLVIFAAVAACSTRDDAKGTELLSQDPTLVARLELDEKARQLPLPSACGTIRIAARPTAANQNQAEALTRQALVAQMHGNEQEAESLLRRASELDGTNKSAAYHLGRTNEALGDRTAAMTAYCRYLALAPTTAESAEARQRLDELSKTKTTVSAGSVGEAAPARRPARVAAARRVTPSSATRLKRTSEPKVVVAGAAVQRPVPAEATRRGVQSASAAGSVDDARTSSQPVTGSPDGGGTTGGSAAEVSVGATQGEVATAEQPSTAPRMDSRGPSRAQSAGIGAAAGAILGAATGRSVKSAVIGAAAGGILGTMVVRQPRPVVRGIRR